MRLALAIYVSLRIIGANTSPTRWITDPLFLSDLNFVQQDRNAILDVLLSSHSDGVVCVKALLCLSDPVSNDPKSLTGCLTGDDTRSIRKSIML